MTHLYSQCVGYAVFCDSCHVPRSLYYDLNRALCCAVLRKIYSFKSKRFLQLWNQSCAVKNGQMLNCQLKMQHYYKYRARRKERQAGCAVRKIPLKRLPDLIVSEINNHKMNVTFLCLSWMTICFCHPPSRSTMQCSVLYSFCISHVENMSGS